MSFNFFKRKRTSLQRPASSFNQATAPCALFASIDETIHFIKSKLGDSPDVICRSFQLGDSRAQAAVIYVNSLTDDNVINKQIIEPLIHARFESGANGYADLIGLIEATMLPISQTEKIDTINACIDALLHGQTALLIDGQQDALVMKTVGLPTRNISQPLNENEVRGPRESFVESMSTNISLIRRKVHHEQLHFENFTLGEKTRTSVCLAYMADLAPVSLVDEVKKRVGHIKMAGILESSYIEEWIQDHPTGLFPQIDYTERPDRAAAMLLEGRVIILVDGTPFALIVPTVFMQFFTTAGDYYMNFYFATTLRWLRLAAFIISLVTPSLYIAITTMHQEMFPTPLALRIAGARSDVPFPAIVEALLMETAFELLREAGIRLPKVAGQAVSIVGALIIGEAAVEAGVVSPIMVMVVALTGISSLALPSFSLALVVRLLRFPLMILASILGIPGITVALLCILTYIASMKSFGLPYLSPLSPAVTADWKDTLSRMPHPAFRKNKHHFAQQPRKSEFEPEDSIS